MTTCGKMIILLTMLTTGGEQILLPMVAAKWPPGSRSPSNCSPPCCKTQFPQSIFLLYMVLIYDSRDNPSCFATTHVGDSQIRKHLILVLPCLLKIPPTKSWRSPLQLFQSIALAMSERENCLAGNLGERDIPELRSSWRHCALGRHSKAGNPLQEISDSAFESFTTIK